MYISPAMVDWNLYKEFLSLLGYMGHKCQNYLLEYFVERLSKRSRALSIEFRTTTTLPSAVAQTMSESKTQYISTNVPSLSKCYTH